MSKGPTTRSMWRSIANSYKLHGYSVAVSLRPIPASAESKLVSASAEPDAGSVARGGGCDLVIRRTWRLPFGVELPWGAVVCRAWAPDSARAMSLATSTVLTMVMDDRAEWLRRESRGELRFGRLAVGIAVMLATSLVCLGMLWIVGRVVSSVSP